MFHVGQQIILSVRIALCLRLLNVMVSLANIVKEEGTMLGKVLWVPMKLRKYDTCRNMKKKPVNSNSQLCRRKSNIFVQILNGRMIKERKYFQGIIMIVNK